MMDVGLITAVMAVALVQTSIRANNWVYEPEALQTK